MALRKSQADSRRGPAGWTDWVNKKLFPWIGPPPLGPYNVVPADEAKAAQAAATCPICGELMSIHEVDRSGERTQIYHPTPEQATERRAALAASTD